MPYLEYWTSSWVVVEVVKIYISWSIDSPSSWVHCTREACGKIVLQHWPDAYSNDHVFVRLLCNYLFCRWRGFMAAEMRCRHAGVQCIDQCPVKTSIIQVEAVHTGCKQPAAFDLLVWNG